MTVPGPIPSLPENRKELIVLVLATSLLLLVGSGNATKASAPPPPAVEVADVIQKDVPIYGEWIATLDGFVNAQIQPHVSGYLIKQNYKESSLVRKGEVLFEIDLRPFKAALDQAIGQLAQAEAQLGKAILDVKRDTPLAQARAIAQSQLDNDKQAKLGAEASVAAAKAMVEQARLNLEFAKVTSLEGAMVNRRASVITSRISNAASLRQAICTIAQDSDTHYRGPGPR